MLERLREALAYDPETGALTWKICDGVSRFTGNTAGCMDFSGYQVLRFGGLLLRVHRIIWALVYGDWPENQIDHINGDRSDNRLINLRAATLAQNNYNKKLQSNSTTGFKGVTKVGVRYYAYIYHSRKKISLGSFATPIEAHAAYCKAADKYHGEFANYGG